jgi:S1-C subfamily serine protease
VQDSSGRKNNATAPPPPPPPPHGRRARAGAGRASRPARASASALEQSYVSVVDGVAPKVVQVSTPRGLGSGSVFDRGGDIVTNAHVVAGGGPLRVTDSRGRTYAGKLVGEFEADDLAVVRAEGASLAPATFADSHRLAVGEIVLAIGNPLELRSSVTSGIVSALGRTVSEPNNVVLAQRDPDERADQSRQQRGCAGRPEGRSRRHPDAGGGRP